MLRRLAPSWPLMVALLVLAAAPRAVGQQNQGPSRGPRFLLAAWGLGREVDASGAPVLRRRVSLDLSGGTLGEALTEITRQADLEILYSPRIVPLDREVSLHAQDITVAAALTEILLDVSVDVSVTSDGGLALVRSTNPAVAPVAFDTGAVAGQVRDSASGSPIVGATVSIEGTRRSSMTNSGGRYRVGGLEPGTYAVRARYIGYRSLTLSVAVKANEEATIDLPLERSAQPLEQVVVTGTVVPTEVKAVPTPVSVINSDDIALQHPQTVQEVFRQAVPGAIGWNWPATPGQTAFSVRGASTLSPGGSQMKVFVDGLEVAVPSAGAVDLNSIQRIEVVRGPQAAAIYGSDAIGGVIQIFTQRGDTSMNRPQITAEAAIGAVQTPYAGYGGVLQQRHTGSIRGGGGGLSYHFGAGYSHTDDYLPNGEQSRQSNPSVYGGMRFARGIISADISGRYYTQNNPAVFNPNFYRTGFAFYSKPLYQPYQFQNQAVGVRIEVAPMRWWHHTVTVGLDRFTQEVAQPQPRLTYPGDTLLLVFKQARTKTSISYTTSIEGALSAGVSGSVTAGIDHYSLPLDQFFTSGALNTTGTIRTASGQSVSASRSITNNTGYFAQIQVGFRGALFATTGVRAEQNTEFGDQLGTPVSPRVGLSYVQSVAGMTLKVRGAYGRAIRAPSAGLKLAVVTPTQVVLANPELGPERQRGWDAGLDAAFGNRGSLSVTYYDQTAADLIQQVRLQGGQVPTFQYQNAGEVRNTGVEIEGTMWFGPMQLKGQYGYARSRVERLPSTYTGDLLVGDQSLGTAKHTAGASFTVTPHRGSTLTGGMTYVGSWNSYDWVAQFSCFGGTGPCQPSNRDYIIAYPGFVKVNASVSQQITRQISGFVGVDNVTNNDAYEFWNFNPVMGRISTIGLRFQY